MDVWVVAAAAGASYVAQHLKNLNRGKHKLSDLSRESPNFVGPGTSRSIEVQGKSCPLWRKSFGEDMFREREEAFQDASATEIASTSCCTFSNSNSLVTFSNVVVDHGDFDSLPQPSPREMGFSCGFRGEKSRFKSRRINSQLIKPRTSLESCLMAQLYKEFGKFEDLMYSDHSPTKPTLRPFLVTDERKVISRAPKMRKDTCLQDAKKTVFGVPQLPHIVPVELQNKDKAKKGKQQVLNHNNAQGSYDRASIFYLGLTMGVLSSSLANKWEMEKLNKLLKQSENLVQDLQEELEMKDSLTVKELAAEVSESRDLDDAPYFDDALHEQKFDNSFSGESGAHKEPEEECMRKIEEELEAELERLESIMKSSSLEGKLSNIAELNPDFVSNVTMGELRADLFGAKTGSQPYADRDGSGSSTHNSTQYPVSPRELSLRLHEVIQSRLEERVKELETALQNSQQKVNEYEHNRPGEVTRPIARDEQQSADEPVVINLSGEALAAYNEAYEEFTKLSDSDEEDLHIGSHQEIFGQCKEVVKKCGVNDDYMEGYLISNGSRETTASSCDEFEDEMERLLIKQIVEKARQGSPALLKAQRSFLLSDCDNEH